MKKSKLMLARLWTNATLCMLFFNYSLMSHTAGCTHFRQRKNYKHGKTYQIAYPQNMSSDESYAQEISNLMEARWKEFHYFSWESCQEWWKDCCWISFLWGIWTKIESHQEWWKGHDFAVLVLRHEYCRKSIGCGRPFHHYLSHYIIGIKDIPL